MRVTYAIENEIQPAEWADANRRNHAQAEMQQRLEDELEAQGLIPAPGAVGSWFLNVWDEQIKGWLPFTGVDLTQLATKRLQMVLSIPASPAPKGALALV